jgi:hypothetical protein
MSEPDDQHDEYGPPGGEQPDGSETARPWLLTAAEAAQMLCISEATLWELVKRDRLRCVEFVARGFRRPIRRFRMQDLVRFIDEAVG